MTTEKPRRSAHRRPSGGIDRRPSGRWRARYLGADGHRHVAQFSTKADADTCGAVGRRVAQYDRPSEA